MVQNADRNPIRENNYAIWPRRFAATTGETIYNAPIHRTRSPRVHVAAKQDLNGGETSMTRHLTEAEVNRYHRDGVLFPIRVLTASETQRYRDACDELEMSLGGKPRTIEVRQMHLHFAWAWNLATEASILDAVEDVLGPDILIWATELFTKHPQDAAVSISWHRDQPYLGLVGGNSTTAWLALCRSNQDNGCMRALPRTSESTTASQSDVNRRLKAPLAEHGPLLADVTLDAGEISLHAADILHGSGPNRSTAKRIGFVIRYITPDARPVHGTPPVLLARGRDRYHHFADVEPPTQHAADLALAGMRDSAREHFNTVLQHLKQSER
jgi:non-heme Fe2+,alpha-ketoglutarate-dependent halogenase